MSLRQLQFEDIFADYRIRDVVEVYDERWSRGGLHAHGGSGPTKYEWFESTTPEERVEQVRAAAEGLRDGTWSWPPLAQVLVSKDPALPEHVKFFMRDVVRFPKRSRKKRPLCMADPLAQTLQYLLAEALQPYVDAKLSKRAIAYRKGLPMVRAVKNVVSFVRSKKLYAAAVLDIDNFYDSIQWRLLDAAIERLDIDEALRSALKALCRVRVVTEKGQDVARTCGISQGLVVAPALANLVLADFDVHVQRIIGRWGVYLWRYADDIALFARDRESLKKAIAVVRTELGQLGLKVKAGTGRIADMRNPDNHPRWLGLLHGHDDLRADPKKLQAKLKKLLLVRDRGLVDDDDLRTRLNDLQDYYERAGLSEQRAEEAVLFIEHALLDQIPPTPRKENIDNIRKQIRTPRLETSTSAPNGDGRGVVPYGEVQPKGSEEEPRFPPDSPGPFGLGSVEGPPGAYLYIPHYGQEVRSQVGPLPEGLHRPVTSLPLGEAGAGQAGGGDLPRPASSHSLVRPQFRPPTTSDPSRPPRRRAYKHHRLRRVRAAIESPWTVEVVDGVAQAWSPAIAPLHIRVEAPEAKSPTEVHLEGYRQVLCVLLRRRAAWIVMRVNDRVLDGYLSHGWKIAKPHILRRWGELTSAIDELEEDGAAVWFELSDGRLMPAIHSDPSSHEVQGGMSEVTT